MNSKLTIKNNNSKNSSLPFDVHVTLKLSIAQGRTSDSRSCVKMMPMCLTDTGSNQ